MNANLRIKSQIEFSQVTPKDQPDRQYRSKALSDNGPVDPDLISRRNYQRSRPVQSRTPTKFEYLALSRAGYTTAEGS